MQRVRPLPDCPAPSALSAAGWVLRLVFIAQQGLHLPTVIEV